MINSDISIRKDRMSLYDIRQKYLVQKTILRGSGVVFDSMVELRPSLELSEAVQML